MLPQARGGPPRLRRSDPDPRLAEIQEENRMTDYAPDRRTLLAGLGGLAVAGIAGPVAAKESVNADARLDTLLSAQFEQGLRDDPPRATSLGPDPGARAALRGQFPDWSAAGRAARARRSDTALAAVRALAADTLGDTAR